MVGCSEGISILYCCLLSVNILWPSLCSDPCELAKCYRLDATCLLTIRFLFNVVVCFPCLLQLYCVVNSDVFVHVHSKSRFFNKDEFLEGVCETERPFYEKVSNKRCGSDR